MYIHIDIGIDCSKTWLWNIDVESTTLSQSRNDFSLVLSFKVSPTEWDERNAVGFWRNYLDCYSIVNWTVSMITITIHLYIEPFFFPTLTSYHLGKQFPCTITLMSTHEHSINFHKKKHNETWSNESVHFVFKCCKCGANETRKSTSGNGKYEIVFSDWRK